MTARDRLIAVEPLAAADPSAIRVVRAPGRVNLIGEHTDYNLGLVLPAAIGLELHLAYVPTADRRVEVTSEATSDRQAFDLDSIGPKRGTWVDYVAGTAWAMAREGLATRGFRGVIASSLPLSSGLSSSAALELAAAWALAVEPGAGVSPLQLARTCQRAENEYVGVNCGLMDQFACACGIHGAAVALDCRSLEWRPVPLRLDTLALVVCHTGSTRSLTASEYNARRTQCEGAVAAIAAADPAVHSLRDLTVSRLPLVRDRMDDETFRRCRHVVTENARVEHAIAAFAAGDLRAIGELWAASHVSLRVDFGVVSSELGGCTVNLVERVAVGALRDRVNAEYAARTGLSPRVWVVDAVAGAGFTDEAA